jgi:hypothetical protein
VLTKYCSALYPTAGDPRLVGRRAANLNWSWLGRRKDGDYWSRCSLCPKRLGPPSSKASDLSAKVQAERNGLCRLATNPSVHREKFEQHIESSPLVSSSSDPLELKLFPANAPGCKERTVVPPPLPPPTPLPFKHLRDETSRKLAASGVSLLCERCTLRPCFLATPATGTKRRGSFDMLLFSSSSSTKKRVAF